MSEQIDTTCANCAKVYPGWSANQADGCACHSRDGFVYGHYGSDYDIECLKWNGIMLLPNMDPICDTCIRAWVLQGMLTYEREYLDFNPKQPS